MCLSTAINDAKPEEILMEYVSAINIDGGDITLTDLMGDKRTFKGSLKFADLTGAVIRIALTE